MPKKFSLYEKGKDEASGKDKPLERRIEQADVPSRRTVENIAKLIVEAINERGPERFQKFTAANNALLRARLAGSQIRQRQIGEAANELIGRNPAKYGRGPDATRIAQELNPVFQGVDNSEKAYHRVQADFFKEFGGERRHEVGINDSLDAEWKVDFIEIVYAPDGESVEELRFVQSKGMTSKDTAETVAKKHQELVSRLQSAAERRLTIAESELKQRRNEMHARLLELEKARRNGVRLDPGPAEMAVYDSLASFETFFMHLYDRSTQEQGGFELPSDEEIVSWKEAGVPIANLYELLQSRNNAIAVANILAESNFKLDAEQAAKLSIAVQRLSEWTLSRPLTPEEVIEACPDSPSLKQIAETKKVSSVFIQSGTEKTVSPLRVAPGGIALQKT